MAHESYNGPLRKDEFQFSFGAKNSTTGFLIPHQVGLKKK